MLNLKRFLSLFIVCAVILTSTFVVSAETINVTLEKSLAFESGGAFLVETGDNYLLAATGQSAKLAYEISVYDKETLSYLTSITASSPSTIYLNVNEMHVKGDYLYAAFVQRSGNGNPLCAKYNIKDIYEGQEISAVKKVGMRPRAYSFMNDDLLCRADSGYVNITFMELEDLDDMSAIGVSTDNAATLKAYTKLYYDNYVLYGIYGKNLYIYDAKDPANGISRQDTQLLKGSYAPGATAITALCGYGKYLYVSTAEGIYVLDMEDLSSPQSLGLIDGTTSAKDIKINNGYMYVSTGTTLKIFDLSDAVNPSLVSSTTVASAINEMNLRPGKIYAATQNGLAIYDVSGLEIEETTVHGSKDVAGTVTYKQKVEGIENAQNICLSDDYLFTLNGEKTEISVYDKNTKEYITKIYKQKDEVNLEICDMYVADGYIYISYDSVFRKYSLSEIAKDAVLKEYMAFPMYSDMTRNLANHITQSDNYIFVATYDSVNRGPLANSKILVYDKETNEYVTSIHMDTGNSNYDAAVRSMWSDGKRLYISYNNAKTSSSYTGSLQAVLPSYARAHSPLCVYSVEEIVKGEALTPVVITSDTESANMAHPYNRGGASYFDEEENLLYQGVYTTGSGQNYKVYDVTGGNKTLKFTLKNGSYDSVKFIAGGGYLFEIIKNNAGLYVSGVTTSAYNKVLVYDISSAESETDLSSKLKGSYQTAIYGDDVIKDVAFDGEYIYVATTQGIDVLDINTCEKVSTISEGKRINCLKAEEGMLFASSQTGVHIYTLGEDAVLKDEFITGSAVYEMDINANEGKIYITDKQSEGYAKVLSYKEESFATEADLPVLSVIDNTNAALSTTKWTANAGQMVLENDKYIFAAVTNDSFTTCGVVQIFEKSSGKLMATLSEATSNSSRYRQIRNMHLYDEVLYVTWGNAYSSGDANAYVLGQTMSPVKVYDVSALTEGTAPTGVTIFTGGQRTSTHAPYILGNITYLDEENGIFYASEVQRKDYNARYYYAFNTSDIKNTLKNGTALSATKRFITGSESMNAVQFMVKDGWLYEVIQNKAGLSSYDCDDTVAGNNKVKAYNLNLITFTDARIDVKNTLRANYVTETVGDNAINDIEVLGKTLYVATDSGIEVVDLSPAEAEGTDSTSPAELVSENCLTVSGKANDLEIIGDTLYAGFSESGAVASYDLTSPSEPNMMGKISVANGAFDICVDKEKKAVLIMHDAKNPPAMSGFTFSDNHPLFGGEDTIKLSHSASVILEDINSFNAVQGENYTLVLSGETKETADKILVYNNSTKLKVCEITKDAGEIGNIKVKGSYFYIYDGNILKVYGITSADGDISELEKASYEASAEINDMCISDTKLYLAKADGIKILDISNISAGTISEYKSAFDAEAINTVNSSGNYVYGAKATGEVFVYDAKTYSLEHETDAEENLNIIRTIVSENEIFCLTDSGSVLIYETNEGVIITYNPEIKEPETKKVNDLDEIRGFPYISFSERVYSTHDKVVANDDYVVTAGTKDIYVYNSSLEEITQFNLSGISKIYLNENLLVVAHISGTRHVSIFDLADSEYKRTDIAVLSNGGMMSADGECIYVYDSSAYEVVVYNYDGEVLYTVTDCPETLTNIYCCDNGLFLINDKTLMFYDASNQTGTVSANDIYVGETSTVQKITEVERTGDYLYVGTHAGNAPSNKLYVYNLKTIKENSETEFTTVESYSTSTNQHGGGKIKTFKICGDYMIIDAVDDGEMQVVNITYKDDVHVESYVKKGKDDSYAFTDIAVGADKVYAISEDGGLCIYDYKAIDISGIEFVSGGNESLTPNGENVSAKIKIYNASGREKEATLYISVYEAGKNQRLLNVTCTDVVAQSDAETVVETPALDIDNYGDIIIKAMLFEKGTNKPLCTYEEALEMSGESEITIYVDSSATEGGDGSKEAPFKTIEEAKEKVRKINKQMSGDITVLIAGGRYELSDTLRFDETDSGFNGYNIIYKAMTDEKPVISGGRKIENWTLYDEEKGIYAADSNGIFTRQLHVDGKSAVRARSEGGLTNATTDGGVLGIYCYDDFIADYKNIKDLELVFIGSFLSKRIGVDDAYVLDSKGRTLLAMNRPFWNYPNSFNTYITPVYYENAIELLDEENEFYLDRAEDKFYYKPIEGTDINSSEIIAPVLEELVTLEGSGLYSKVKNVHFEGIEFADTTWLTPSTDGGYYPNQAGQYDRPVFHKTLTGNVIEEAINIHNAENISITSCVLRNFGGNGMNITTSTDISVVGNKIYDISAGAIYVGSVDAVHANPVDDRKFVRNIKVENNYLDDIANEYYTSCAIIVGTTQNCSVSHNEVSNTPYTALHFGWGWDSYPKRNITGLKVQYNYIHDACLKLGDGGAIYTTGYTYADATENPNYISNNYIGRVEGNGVFAGAAIYLDTGSSGYRVAENVIDLRESASAWIPKWSTGNTTNVFDGNYTTTVNGGSGHDINTTVSETADWDEKALSIIANAGLESEYQHLKN